MLISNTERHMLRLDLQFFGAEGEGNAAAGEETGAGAAAAGDPQGTGSTEQKKQQETALTKEDIQKLIQSAVDTQTAKYGKTIAEQKKEIETLKKANMTAEEIQKADKEEFERQKAEVELGKRQIHAHRVVAAAGYGDNAEAVVNLVLGGTDEDTDKRLSDFKALVDKIVQEKVNKTFKENGRNPNGGSTGGSEENKNENNIAAELGKKAAAQREKSNEILKQYGL